jgi:hypothetical protein
MTTVYPEQFREVSPHYCLNAGWPKRPLANYMDILNSYDFCWRAVLTIATAYCSATDLTAIPKIKNLVALDLHNKLYSPHLAPLDPVGLNNEGHPLEDGFVRGWVESNALQHLRILRFYHQHQITIAMLRALRELPELQLIVACECRKIKQKMQDHARPENDSIPIEGWLACRLDWFWERQGTSKTIDDHLLGLLHVYQSSLQTPEGRPSSLDPKLSILEFKLPTVDHSRSRVVIRSRYNAKAIVLFTRDPVELNHDAENKQREKTKRQPEPPETGGRPPKRATMKERGPVDISNTLKEFF